MHDNEIEVNDIFIENCLENFDEDSQLKMKNCFIYWNLRNIKKAQEISFKICLEKL